MVECGFFRHQIEGLLVLGCSSGDIHGVPVLLRVRRLCALLCRWWVMLPGGADTLLGVDITGTGLGSAGKLFACGGFYGDLDVVVDAVGDGDDAWRVRCATAEAAATS